MKISKVTAVYIMLFVYAIGYTVITDGSGVLYAGTPARYGDPTTTTVYVVMGETITMKVTGNDAEISINFGVKYNGNYTILLDLKEGESVTMRFEGSNRLDIYLESEKPMTLTVTKTGISLENRLRLVAMGVTMTAALIVEWLVKRMELSFPILSFEMKSISLAVVSLVFLMIWRGDNFLPGGSSTLMGLEYFQKRYFMAFRDELGFPIILPLILSLHINRVLKPRNMKMLKTYPLSPIQIYLSRIAVFLFVYFPFFSLSFIHLIFGRGTLLQNFDGLTQKYILPAMVAFIAILLIFLIVLLIEDMIRIRPLTLSATLLLLVLTGLDILTFYPFYIYHQPTSLDDENGYLNIPDLKETAVVAISTALIMMTLNILYRRSKYFQRRALV